MTSKRVKQKSQEHHFVNCICLLSLRWWVHLDDAYIVYQCLSKAFSRSSLSRSTMVRGSSTKPACIIALSYSWKTMDNQSINPHIILLTQFINHISITVANTQLIMVPNLYHLLYFTDTGTCISKIIFSWYSINPQVFAGHNFVVLLSQSVRASPFLGWSGVCPTFKRDKGWKCWLLDKDRYISGYL